MKKNVRWTYGQTIFIPIGLITAGTLLCTYVALYRLPYIPSDGMVLAFYRSFTALLGIPGFIALTLFIALLSWVLADSYLNGQKAKSKQFLRVFSSFVFSTLSAMVLAIHFSFFITLLLVYNELSPLQEYLPDSIRPQIRTEVEVSREFLLSQEACPAISFSESDAFKKIADISLKEKSYSSFIRQSIAPPTVDFNYLTLPTTYGSFVFQDTLFLLKTPPEMLQPLAAPLAQKLITCEFDNFPTKSFPQAQILREDEYIDYINTQLTSLLKQQEQYITEADKTIRELTTWIAQMKRNRYSSRLITEAENALKEWQAHKQKLLSDKEEIQARIKAPAQEVGHFFPPDKISVKFLAGRDGYLTVSTLVHEYLHYTSDTQNHYLDRFFEEGLTQYFTLKIMSRYQTYPTTTTYSLPVFTILSLDKIAPEAWEEIYLSKDAGLLERELDTHYGEGFYKTSKLTFQEVYDKETESARLALNEQLSKYGVEIIPAGAFTTPYYWREKLFNRVNTDGLVH
ncbi:MAG: hypothetical protein QY314_03380 [Candidatus Dojkabacteria bacterium]|nr:MAG: hypothetical protein QY314_03380 [Candidatus Dojkabacteria bacterium]